MSRPVIPGIMPVTNLAQVQRFAALSGAEFPAELCRGLLDAGAPGLHFYTLNRARATTEIFTMLGLDLPQTAP